MHRRPGRARQLRRKRVAVDGPPRRWGDLPRPGRGRGFHVLVAVGRSAPKWRVNAALATLDSMQLSARRPVRLNPNDAVAEHVASAGIDFVHPSAWRWYRGALTQAIAARDQIAL